MSILAWRAAFVFATIYLIRPLCASTTYYVYNLSFIIM